MSVEEVKDESGNIRIIRATLKSGSQCEIYTFGATVTKFTTPDGKDLIWLSSTAKLDGTKAIRGGIPLVFPHFGQPIKEMPQHGFARNNTWKVEGTEIKDDAFQTTLSLDQTMATHEAWPFPYKLELVVAMKDNELKTQYIVTNTGPESFRFQSLQHTYLNVADISATTVTGLMGQRYLDKTAADTTLLNIEERGAADITQFVDRVYVGTHLNSTPGGVLVKCPTGKIRVQGSATYGDGIAMPSDTVMWNPWAEKAKGMGDFDDDGYLKMLCIEPGLVQDFHMLPAGYKANLTQVLSFL